MDNILKRLSKTSSQFKKITIVIFISLGALSCSTIAKTSTVQDSHSTIRLEIENGIEIENIIMTKFGGFAEEDIRPFHKISELTYNEPIHDFYQILLQTKDDRFISNQLWLEGNDVIIIGKVVDDQLQIDTVINSPFYYYTNQIISKYTSLKKANKSQDEISDFLLTEIKNNIDNAFSNELSSLYLKLNVSQTKNLKLLQSIIKNQNNNIKGHMLSIHDDLKKQIEVVSINLEKYEFNYEQGKTVNLNLKKDSIYLLDFWFTACKPCIADHKTIDSLSTYFKNTGVEVLGISTDYDQSVWEKFLQKKNYSWKNYIELSEDENTLSDYLGISVFPTYIIINGTGEILYRNISLEKSMALLNEVYVSH